MRKHPVDIHLGKRLKELRLERNLTVAEFAAKVNLSAYQYRRYETAESQLKCYKAVEIAELLHVRVESLIKGYVQAVPALPPKRGAKPSPQREKMEKLRYAPIGTSIRFSHGSFDSPAAAKRMIANMGRAGWCVVNPTTTGYTVKKVSEP